jgi:hypothetical protein
VGTSKKHLCTVIQRGWFLLLSAYGNGVALTLPAYGNGTALDINRLWKRKGLCELIRYGNFDIHLCPRDFAKLRRQNFTAIS